MLVLLTTFNIYLKSNKLLDFIESKYLRKWS